MPLFKPLTGDQVRQVVNTEQLYGAYRQAVVDRDQRFRGSVSWKTVKGREYLYRKSADRWICVGRRDSETEKAHERFTSGRAAVRLRIKTLDAELRTAARVNHAMRLGRLPWVAARLLRQLESRHLLGNLLSVVGTHALFAYERMAGGHLHGSQLATDDIDLLYDARQRVDLVAAGSREQGLEGILRDIDPSFRPVEPGSFRAVNDKGYMVDLITPLPRNPSQPGPPARIGGSPDDMTAAEIEGLGWLQNCPQIEQVVLDERGYPVTLHVPDPRAFALHKLWVAEREDRDRLKARRDSAQAFAVAGLIVDYLPHMRFDDPALSALPEPLRAKADVLIRGAAALDDGALEDW